MKKQSALFMSLSVLLTVAPLSAVEQSTDGYWHKALGQLVGPQYQETLSQLGQLFGGSSQPTAQTDQTKSQHRDLYQAVLSGDIQRVHQALKTTNFDKETLIEYALLAEKQYLATQASKFKDIKALIENKINPTSATSSAKSFGLSDLISTLGTYMGGSQQSQPAEQNTALSTVMDFIKQYGSSGANQQSQTPEPAKPQPKRWYDYFAGR